MRRLACALLALAALPLRALGADDPRVTVVIHVPLAVPQLLVPARDAYCMGESRPYRLVPAPDRVIEGYERELRALGPVTDHDDLGTWTVGASDLADVAFEPVDHLFVRLPLRTVPRAVPPLLHRMRRDLHQQEALAEIIDGAYPALGQVRTRISVVLPYGDASHRAVTALHRIFGDRGRGGASQYAQADGLHVYSSVLPRDAGRIERALRAAGFRFTRGTTTFIAEDAPSCARLSGRGTVRP
ncbi:MAG TPA: hypothetical protein VMA36_01840 [Candidatus Limnocylindria bacterium]|jgi:hypothetical protein|nr:hypothetical protein [Candidatus Limnocylindria bacterium]